VIVRLIATALGLYAAVALVGGLDYQGDWPSFAIVAVILAVVNAVLKPLVKLLSLPFIVLTLGLFLLVVNALMLWLVVALSEGMDLGLTSDGFGSIFLGAVIISLITWLADRTRARGPAPGPAAVVQHYFLVPL
jgi:putative membrane protein